MGKMSWVNNLQKYVSNDVPHALQFFLLFTFVLIILFGRIALEALDNNEVLRVINTNHAQRLQNRERGSRNAQPGIDIPEDGSDNSEPGADSPQLDIDVPEPGGDNSGPGTDNPELGPENPQPGPDNMGPDYDNPEPDYDIPEPDHDIPEPDAEYPEHDRHWEPGPSDQQALRRREARRRRRNYFLLILQRLENVTMQADNNDSEEILPLESPESQGNRSPEDG